MTTCVFCGRPIAPDEKSAGRPPMAAHASCADAALADDRHWDAIADRSPEAETEAEEPGSVSEVPSRASGCLTATLLALVVLLVLAFPF